MASPGDDAKKYQSGDPLPAARVPAGVIISSDTQRAERIPPGQSRTRKWPVLHYGGMPQVTREDWSLEVRGLVEEPLQLGWDQFQQLPRVQVFADFHCVTRWSRLGNLWEGVSTRELLERARVKPEAEFVILHGFDGDFTTNLPLDAFLSEDALLADLHDGDPLSLEHGGPVRAIIPKLYAWKSAKWVKAVELTADDRPGLWERGGYHNHGDPWIVSDRHPDGERFG